MKLSNEQVLIVGDNSKELAEIKSVLSSGYTRLHATTNLEYGYKLFEEKRPAVLLLSFASLNDAEKFYLKLHNCSNIYETHHHTILLTPMEKLEQAYNLCSMEIFNDFVISRPLVSEHRLKLSVAQGLEKRALRMRVQEGQIMLKRLAKQVDKTHEELSSIASNIPDAIEQPENQQTDLLGSIANKLKIFRDSLMGPSMHSMVKTMDPTLTRERFDRSEGDEMHDELVRHHGQMDKALMSWTDNLNIHLKKLEEKSSTKSGNLLNKSKNILVIDDDDSHREIISSALKQEGYTIQQASDGVEGLQLISNNRPDIILLDYEMPGLDGKMVIKKIRSLPHLSTLPIVMLTGHGEKNIVRDCLFSGADDYLVKPIKRKKLLERIEEVLTKH